MQLWFVLSYYFLESLKDLNITLEFLDNQSKFPRETTIYPNLHIRKDIYSCVSDH